MGNTRSITFSKGFFATAITFDFSLNNAANVKQETKTGTIPVIGDNVVYRSQYLVKKKKTQN